MVGGQFGWLGFCAGYGANEWEWKCERVREMRMKMEIVREKKTSDREILDNKGSL